MNNTSWSAFFSPEPFYMSKKKKLDNEKKVVPKAPKERKKKLSEDQWANLIARNHRLDPPIDGLHFSLVWEDATQTFWEYKDGSWNCLSPMELTQKVRGRMIASEPYTMNRGKDVEKQLAFEVQSFEVLADEWIAFTDGVWHPVTEDFLPPSPARIATISVNAPFSSMPDWKDGELFQKFLSDICVSEEGGPNQEMMDLLQEMFGYCLFPNAKRAVAFFLSGKGRNGKGVLLELLRHILNKRRVTNMSLSDLTSSRFATANLVGMVANIADETNTNREAVSDMFKKLVATDSITAERKFRDSFQFKPRCKFLFNVNGVPSFDSFGHAMRERIIPIPFFRTFSEDERDYDLTDKIVRDEMPFVVAWAMEGLRRLRNNKWKFTKFKESSELLEEFEHLSDPLSEYLEMWEAEEPGVRFSDFYSLYHTWCKTNGRYPASSRKVGIRLKEKFGKPKDLWDQAERKYNRHVPIKMKFAAPPTTEYPYL